jgi:hypothetical protein
MKYDRVFISYAHEDAEIARRLAHDLVNSAIPVWFDEWELEKHLEGKKLYQALRLAAHRCHAGLFLRTKTYNQRFAMMHNEEGRTAAWYWLWAGRPKWESLEKDPPLAFETQLEVYEPGPYSKYLFAVLDPDNEDFGRKSRFRGAVYQHSYTRYGKLEKGIAKTAFIGYKPSDGPLLSEEVWIPFSDYHEGLMAIIEELDAFPGEMTAEQKAAADAHKPRR